MLLMGMVLLVNILRITPFLKLVFGTTKLVVLKTLIFLKCWEMVISMLVNMFNLEFSFWRVRPNNYVYVLGSLPCFWKFRFIKAGERAPLWKFPQGHRRFLINLN